MKVSNKYSDKLQIESSKYPYSNSIGSVEINETLSFTCSLERQKTGFKRKNIEILVVAHLDNSISKRIAVLEVNLAEVCERGMKREWLLLKECADRQAKVMLSVEAVLTEGDEVMSNGSGTNLSGSEYEPPGSVASDETNKSQLKKPPIHADFKEKINKLSSEIESLTQFNSELKINLKISSEKHQVEEKALKDQIAELEQRLKDSEDQCQTLKANKKKEKKKYKKLQSEKQELMNRIEKFEDELAETDSRVEKARLRKRTLKEHLKEVLENEQKISQENIQLKFVNEDLSMKLKKRGEEISKIAVVDIENIEAPRSRRNTDVISQLKGQIMILEEQKESALSKQTELTFSLQKIRNEMLEIEEMHKREIAKLESEISSLKSEKVSYKSAVEPTEFKPRDFRPVKFQGKNKINELIRNIKGLRMQKEEAENRLYEYETQTLTKVGQPETSSLELKKKISIDEQIIKSLRNQLESKDKEYSEAFNYNQELKKEIVTLKNHLKVYSESEFSSSALGLLQEQLKNCEYDIELLNSQLKAERLQHAEEVKDLLDHVNKLKNPA